MFGIPGTVKTSIVNDLLTYSLEKYQVDSYTFLTTDIIEADLGKTVSNFREQIDEFGKKKQGILFVDEIDKFCVNRNNSEEISEMKRLLIEFLVLDTNVPQEKDAGPTGDGTCIKDIVKKYCSIHIKDTRIQAV